MLTQFKRRRNLAAGEVERMVSIPEDHLKCAIYLCTEGEDGHIAPRATAFFISTELEGGGGSVGYVVTARHCLYEARAEGHEFIYLRLNRSDAGYYEAKTKIDDWAVADAADVAAIMFVPIYLPGGMRFQDFDVKAFQTRHFVGGPPDFRFLQHTADVNFDIIPRVGTDVFFTGLFTETYGVERNLPVARFGHLSRMPSDLKFNGPSEGEFFYATGYLAEFHSWGGHSGSPVFFMEQNNLVTILVDEDGNETGFREDLIHVSGFLGMISAHYDIPARAEVTGELGTVTTLNNSGMAIVVPAYVIKELLLREDFVQDRKRLREEILAQNKAKEPAPTYDFARATETFTRDDFTGALRRVARRATPSESDEASSGT